MREIKNYEKMSKEELPELFNNNLDNDKISKIIKILNKLRDVLTKKYRKNFKKKLYKVENKKDLPILEKEEINKYLTELVRIFNKQE